MFRASFGKYLGNALVAAVAGRAATIVRTEVEDAKQEIQTKAKGLGVGAVLIGIASAFALLAFVLMMVAAVVGLANVWPLWLAALVIGGGLLLIAAILIGAGMSTINKNKNLKPERAIANLDRYFGR